MLSGPFSTSGFRAAAIVVAAALVLGGCGRKGELERPGANIGQTSPAPQSEPEISRSGSITGGFSASVDEEEPEPDVPDRPFVLDALIN